VTRNRSIVARADQGPDRAQSSAADGAGKMPGLSLELAPLVKSHGAGRISCATVTEYSTVSESRP